MDHTWPWLKHVAAGDLNEAATFIDGMNVESPTGEHLGTVEGFIVDVNRRPYYTVVDAGGWFTSKHFLLPIGRTRIGADREVLEADLTRDRIEKFPGFDLDRFDQLAEADLQRLNRDIARVCGADGVAVGDSAGERADFEHPDYRIPDWWRTPTTTEPGGSVDRIRSVASSAPLGTESRRTREAERIVAAATDSSPHFEGRAQPGDVIGVETGGEQTHIGETGEDEDKRRMASERAVAKESKLD